ncbi:MAG: NAD+ synthase [Sulfurimonadaceae bacterium]|nr:NAD+ synthase [Sulfurimonadaceae bacterium]
MDTYEEITQHLKLFLQEEVAKTGFSKVVVGLSGGLDSAVVAVLAQMVFGENLLCVMMPSHYSSQSSVDDAKKLCDAFGINAIILSIEPMLRVYEELHPDMDNLRRGNLSSRLRMATLFDVSAKENALVLGTTNKSELMLGYGTIFGDLASALNPIGDLYKSEIYELAAHLDVTQSIIDKKPSADLWAGQSDEDDLGYSYAKLDAALLLYVDKKLPKGEILHLGIEKEMLEMIVKRIERNEFKRKMPLIAKVKRKL